MANEIISYHEMCGRERTSLQRGMNFNLGGGYSVILMSVRKNAPYHDRFEEDGSTIVYEGHDVPRGLAVDSKRVDQVSLTPAGRKTQNGLFFDAAISHNKGYAPAHLVKVYEKIHQGIWSYNGLFNLVDAWQESSSGRKVFKFKLVAADSEHADGGPSIESAALTEHRRLIPTPIKIEVWDRDKGRCVICGATNELHFDHVLPYSKGGTSLKAENVQLLCARHNLSKGSKIL